jgi:hypothetical protein
MKKHDFPAPLISTFALAVLILSGCGKSNIPPASISAMVGNQPWRSQFVVGLEPPGLHVISLIGYYGHSGDTSQLEVDIADTIPLNQPDPLFHTAVRYMLGNGITYEGEPSIGAHGTVTITSWDTAAHRIAGSFQGTLYNASNSKDSITVINGDFNAGY